VVTWHRDKVVTNFSDLKYINKDTYDKSLAQADLIGLMLTGLKESLNSKRNIPILS
jgi:hypothetical protein